MIFLAVLGTIVSVYIGSKGTLEEERGGNGSRQALERELLLFWSRPQMVLRSSFLYSVRFLDSTEKIREQESCV